MQNGRGSGIEGNWQLHNFISLLAHSLFIRWLCARIRKALVSAKLSTKPAWCFPFTGRKSPPAFLDALEKHSEHIILYYFESIRSAWETGTYRLHHPSFPRFHLSWTWWCSEPDTGWVSVSSLHWELSIWIQLQSSPSASFLKKPQQLLSAKISTQTPVPWLAKHPPSHSARRRTWAQSGFSGFASHLADTC